MVITGIADEAGASLGKQIQAHQELGWKWIDFRAVCVNGERAANIHDLSDADFATLEEQVRAAGLNVFAFSSNIASWTNPITGPFKKSLEETRRVIPRMQRLGVKRIRIMSYGVLPDTEDQMKSERFRRLRELVRIFSDAGMEPLHENCANYGGMGPSFTLELIEAVPGLKLIFDTGNPIFTPDRSKPEPWPRQSAWEFYQLVRDHVRYVHIKDGIWDPETQKIHHTFPGEGQGHVRRILQDLKQRGYEGALCIEPHLTSSSPEEQYANYVEYGRRLGALWDSLE